MSLARACFNSLDNLARSSALSPFPHQPAEHSAWEVHQHNVRTGWRTSFYIQTGLGIFAVLVRLCVSFRLWSTEKNISDSSSAVADNPRHTLIISSKRGSWKETVHALDLIGVSLLAAGLVLLLVGSECRARFTQGVFRSSWSIHLISQRRGQSRSLEISQAYCYDGRRQYSARRF